MLQTIHTMDGNDASNMEVDSLNIYGATGSIIARQNISDDSANTYLYTQDMQGSTMSTLDSNLSAKGIYHYTDYGETTELKEDTTGNEICYTGGIYDKDTGEYYLNARYYDPETAVFTTADSYRGEADQADTWNLYAYCANNPINYVDPSGHFDWPISIKHKYIKRGFLANIIDGAVALITCGVAFFPVEKMAKSYFKQLIKEGKKKLLKRKSISEIKEVKNKITGCISNIYKTLSDDAKKIKNKSLNKAVNGMLNSRRIKYFFKTSATGFFTGKLTGYIGQVIKYEEIDCLLSLGGFIAGAVQLEFNDDLSGSKIYF